MTVTKLSLLAAVVAAGFTGAGLYSHRKHEVQEARRLRGDTMRLQQALDARVHALTSASDRQSTATTSSQVVLLPRPVATAESGVSTKTEPDYRNEGNATPQATLQTIAWACDQGDLGAVTRLIHFDAAARTQALAYMAELPEDVRKRWTTPEAMGAMLLVDAGMHSPFPHATVLDTVITEKISPERVKLHLSGIRRADSEYQLTPEGWKYAITSESVEAYIAQSKNRE